MGEFKPYQEISGEDYEYKRLSGKEKYEQVLKLFGTEQAKARFLNLSREYFQIRQSQPEDIHGENLVLGKRKYSPPKRAEIHNQIMETLKRLATQHRGMSPIQEKIIFEMASRENAAKIIKEYFLAIEGREADDEDEVARRAGRSDTAYYHGLGKEH